MLSRIACTPLPSPSVPVSNNLWDRNELEDMKTAIEYLYEFRKKLAQLHPYVLDHMEHLLQKPRF
jgi:hypothetical protein